jgi:putative colanic acid biosynthesis acetyltransferase WcaF
MILQGVDSRTKASFSLRNRALRMAWALVYSVAFRTSPRVLHGWRRLLLRAFGAEVGAGAHIYPGVKIWAPWNLEIGSYVGVASGVILYSMDKIKLGNGCVVSQGTHLCTGTHDFNDATFQLMARPISIGANAWLCAESFVAPGVNIADGVVVGARSVVTRELTEPWTVYAGTPARKIALRINHEATRS